MSTTSIVICGQTLSSYFMGLNIASQDFLGIPCMYVCMYILDINAHVTGGGGGKSSLGETLALFQHPAAYKPFAILLLVFIFQQLSGSYAIIFYAVNVFRDIGVSTNPYIPTIITGLIRTLGTLIGTALVKVNS